MSETIVRKGPFIPSRPTGGYCIVRADGAVLAIGTKASLDDRVDMYGEGARVELRGKR